MDYGGNHKMFTFIQKVEIKLLPFSDLALSQLQDLFRLRQNVFIIEQNCFYEDIDGEDPKAHHLLVYKEGTLAAYMRIFLAGEKYDNEANMGRIVVHPDFRGTGIADILIQHGIEFCGSKPIRIEAQAGLKAYYRNFGFVEDSKVYTLDGIDHLEMLRKADK